MKTSMRAFSGVVFSNCLKEMLDSMLISPLSLRHVLGYRLKEKGHSRGFAAIVRGIIIVARTVVDADTTLAFGSK